MPSVISQGCGRPSVLHVTVVKHLHGAQVHAPTFQHQLNQTSHVKVHVGDRREQGFFDEGLDFGIGLAQAARVVLVSGHAFETVKQNLLQGFDVGILTAVAGLDTAGPRGGLLTLVAVHGSHNGEVSFHEA